MRVLLVEDDALQRRLLSLRLAAAGLAVDEAADGLAAWQKLEAAPPDALLLDIELPGLGGLALLERLRASDRPLPPTVLLSARNDPGERERALGLGALALLPKPPSLPELLALIGAAAPAGGAR
jgi:two-component system response regulator MprA